MSNNVTLNNLVYIIPDPGENGWGQNLTNFFIAIPAGVLQKSGGLFTLTADTDFGAGFGIKSLYFKSRTAGIASTGQIRLAKTDTIEFRNNAGGGDLALGINGSDQLIFNGSILASSSLTNAHIFVGNGSNQAADVAMSGHIHIDNAGATTIQAGVIVDSMINSTASITLSKLAFGTAYQLVGTNSGATSLVNLNLVGTANQVVITPSGSNITLSLPQSIATSSSPTFAALTLGGNNQPLVLTDNTTNTISIEAPNSVTSWIMKLPPNHGSNGQLLQTDGAGVTTWVNAPGTGTVNSGTAGQLAYYATSTNAVSTLPNIAVDATGLLNVPNTKYQVSGHQLLPILQIQQFTTNTTSSNNTGTFTDSNVLVSITPKFNTSKILIFVSGTCTQSAGASGYITLARNGTNLGSASGFNAFAGNSVDPVSIMYYDSPATTSAITYSVQLKTDSGTTMAFPTNAFGTEPMAVIIAVEIAQ